MVATSTAMRARRRMWLRQSDHVLAVAVIDDERQEFTVQVAGESAAAQSSRWIEHDMGRGWRRVDQLHMTKQARHIP